MIKINPKQICTIEISYKEKSNWMVYKKTLKFLTLTYRKGGFYNILGDRDKNVYNYYCENNIVYVKPYIIIKMSNKQQFYIYFNAESELDIYLENFKDIPFVVLHEKQEKS